MNNVDNLIGYPLTSMVSHQLPTILVSDTFSDLSRKIKQRFRFNPSDFNTAM